MQIDQTQIYFPKGARLREEYGDLKDLVNKIVKYGQLQPILVRPFRAEDYPGVEGEYEFTLIDGGRRFVAFQLLHHSKIPIRGVEPGKILGIVEGSEEARDPLFALEMEFYANEARKDFDWKEKASFIRQIHFGHIDRARADGKVWSALATANTLGVTETTVNRYLELTEDPDVFEDENVQEAKTFVAASKHAKRAKTLKKRKRAAKTGKIATDASPHDDDSSEDIPIYVDVKDSDVFDMCINEDARTWIKSLADESIDFFHWDPPYGGEQSGGSSSIHERIDDSEEYAKSLMESVIPEIFRVLKDGHWLAIWYHQSNKRWLQDLLESTGFWVNPYPNIWYKRNRVADGHEIKRFLTNAYEPFFFAAKVTSKDTDPIMVRNDRQNVFIYDIPTGGARRHIMHKPYQLLAEIISCISVSGELGADCSLGSGSFLEAGVESNRKVIGCEISEEYWLIACDATKKMLIKPKPFTSKDDALRYAVQNGANEAFALAFITDMKEITGGFPTKEDLDKLAMSHKKDKATA